LGFGIWDTSEDYESKKWVGVQVYALLLTSSDALLLAAVEAEGGFLYRRIGVMFGIYGSDRKAKFKSTPRTVLSLI
jgi:hypothetical protein